LTTKDFFWASDQRLRPIWRFVLSVVVVVMALGLVSPVPRSSSTLGGSRTVLLMALLLALLVGGFAALLYCFDRERGRLLRAMGLPFSGDALRDAGLGVVFGMTMVSTCVGAVAAMGSAHFQVGSVRAGPVAAVAVATLVAAMNEEVIFRGYPFQRLVEAIGAPLAVTVLAALFGAGHLRNPNATIWGALNTVGFGVFTALAYLRTRSLWLPWGMHFSWNLGLGLGYGLTVSGINLFSVVVHGSLTGPLWLTGGSYGIEGSATATVALLVATVILLALVKQRPRPQITAGENPPPDDPDQVPLGRIQ